VHLGPPWFRQRVAEPLARWIAAPQLPARPGDAPGALRPSAAQRLREVAYVAGGHAILNRA